MPGSGRAAVAPRRRGSEGAGSPGIEAFTSGAAAAGSRGAGSRKWGGARRAGGRRWGAGPEHLVWERGEKREEGSCLENFASGLVPASEMGTLPLRCSAGR